jgi:hypothetical protein
VDLYSKCVTRGDRSLAKEQLRLHQRENIAWERDTVWRQMIGQERRGEGVIAEGATLVKPEEPPVISFETPAGQFKITKRKMRFLFSILLFVVMINVKMVQGVEANNCIAILTFCTILWATEVRCPTGSLCYVADVDGKGYSTVRDVNVCAFVACAVQGYPSQGRPNRTVSPAFHP